jgi:UDP-N-acetylmuramoyl-tripeptide--D-alanyl-D-alanine ligase
VELTAAELATATGGEVIAGQGDARATSFTMDSRLVDPGGCFVALVGGRDGHDFVADAFAAGATVALVQRELPGLPVDATLVRVTEPYAALAALARAARDRIAGATVIGITGSAGKTATKDLAAAALARGLRTYASPGSYNNEAGLPLTLLGVPPDVEAVVLEMGARFPGNIAELAELARPQVGVVTHVGMAHAAHLGGRDGIARVKGELLEALPTSGLAVLNHGCDHSGALARRTSARVVLVGREAGADVRAVGVTLDDELRARFRLETPWGEVPVALQLRGEHQVENASMAAAVALHLGVPADAVTEGLSEVTGAPHRMQLVHTAGGVTVLNDAYNSSPTSATAAVRALAHLPVAGRRIAVLGEMLELGAHATAEHAALGALATAVGIDRIIAVGPDAGVIAEGSDRAFAVRDAEAAIDVLAGEVHGGDAVLVKASRAVGLERVVDFLASREPVA